MWMNPILNHFFWRAILLWLRLEFYDLYACNFLSFQWYLCHPAIDFSVNIHCPLWVGKPMHSVTYLGYLSHFVLNLDAFYWLASYVPHNRGILFHSQKFTKIILFLISLEEFPKQFNWCHAWIFEHKKFNMPECWLLGVLVEKVTTLECR